jgi:hypothetical protein
MVSYRQNNTTPVPKLEIISSQKTEDVEKSEKRQNLIIPLISISILVLFIIILLFIVWREIFAKPFSVACPLGLCATNIYTGEKRCPSNNIEVISSDPTYEVCNVANACTNITTPCLYYDTTIGTVCPGDPLYKQINGICPNTPSAHPVSSTTSCKCMSLKFCPNFATVYFNQETIENPGITNPSGQNQAFNTYVQNTVWIDPTNAPRTDQPLSPGRANNTASTTCGISSSNLQNVWPTNSCVRGTLTHNQQDNLWYCTNVPSSLNCPIGYVPNLESDGTYNCVQLSSNNTS